MRIFTFLLSLILFGCDAPGGEDAARDAAAESELNNANSQPIQRLAQEDLPGKAAFERACASCHDGTVKKAPHRDMVALMTPDAILLSMTDGVMQAQASVLTPQEQQDVAEYLSGDVLGGAAASIPMCESPDEFRQGAEIVGGNWGLGIANQRDISAAQAGISSANVQQLETKWAIAMPGANRVRSQPTFAGDLVLVGAHSGGVYALNRDTGCAVWRYQASAEVRTAIAVEEFATGAMAYFGDVLGNVYGLNAMSGAEVWKIRGDDHPNATITGAPTPFDGTLYVPLSSLEVSNAIDPYYACCTFRGSVLALDGMTGEEQWRTYTILEEPEIFGQNPVGTNIIGPSGATVWNSPSIDVVNRHVIVGTGENMSSPATGTSDALIAMDLDSGEIQWVFQGTANDAWNVSCDTPRPDNCPEEDGPDFDFGGASVVMETTDHGRIVVAGQKSGMVHAVDAETGELIWQTRAGRGGIQGGIHFGIAVSGEVILVPVSDMEDGRTYPDPDQPGMHAIDANTGELMWSVVHEDQCAGRDFCHPGISQVATVIGDLVVAGSMDGVTRAYDVSDGKIRWTLDTTANEYPSITGKPAIGGSMGGAAGPMAHNGMLLLSSGYGIYNHMAGNLLLALEVSNSSEE